MPRRDPFENLTLPSADRRSPSADAPGTPPSPLDLIPRARRKKRRREWERRHRGFSYKVPHDLVARAQDVREAITGLAQAHMTTSDQLATALMIAALDAVQDGEITLNLRPNPQGRKMTVEVVREPGWKHEPPAPKRRRRKPTLVLTYRWPVEVHRRIQALVGEARIGEAVVVLLEAALERVREGRWSLRPRVISVTQETEIQVGSRNSGGSSW